jgi:hypothetical protein
MGIRGDDARIQLQKLGDVDQIDKQQQEVQRGEAGAVRSKSDKERERRQTTSTEMEKPDTVLVRESPHRKRGEGGRAEGDEEEESTEEEPKDKEKKDLGGTLDVKG